MYFLVIFSDLKALFPLVYLFVFKSCNQTDFGKTYDNSQMGPDRIYGAVVMAPGCSLSCVVKRTMQCETVNIWYEIRRLCIVACTVCHHVYIDN